MRKTITWNVEKARKLYEDTSRGGISFEDCVIAIEEGNVLDIIQNPSINHPNQKIYVLEIGGYAYSVPFTETDEEIFLKTLFPSRKLTAIYLNKRKL